MTINASGGNGLSAGVNEDNDFLYYLFMYLGFTETQKLLNIRLHI